MVTLVGFNPISPGIEGFRFSLVSALIQQPITHWQGRAQVIGRPGWE
jgi:hypothetical protein